MLRYAILAVLMLLFSVPLLFFFLSALSGPVGFLLVVGSMMVFEVPLVWILIRFRVLPQVTLGRPPASTESSNMNAPT